MGPITRAGAFTLATTVGNVLVSVAVDGDQPSAVYTLKRMLVELASAHPNGVGYFHVVAPRDGAIAAPPPETRKAFVELASALGGPQHAACVVYERTGFRGAVVRAIASGIFLLARLRQRSHVAAGIVDGARWLADALRASGAGHVSAAALTDAAEQLLAQADRRPA